MELAIGLQLDLTRYGNAHANSLSRLEFSRPYRLPEKKKKKKKEKKDGELSPNPSDHNIRRTSFGILGEGPKESNIENSTNKILPVTIVGIISRYALVHIQICRYLENLVLDSLKVVKLQICLYALY